MHLPRALLLGSGGRLPFRGHLRLAVDRGQARLAVAARVAHGAPPPESWDAVLRLHAALSEARGADRWQLCRDAWERLVALEAGALGPAEGADLSLIMVTEDAEGETVSGVGLSGLWTLERGALRRVVPLGHPLLGEAGRPTAPPKVLAPAQPGPVYLASCAGEAQEPAPRGVLDACGVRP